MQTLLPSIHGVSTCTGPTLTNYAMLKETGRSTSAKKPIGTRKFSTLRDKHPAVQAATKEMFENFCAVADPGNVNYMTNVTQGYKSQLGFLEQTEDAQRQVMHTDGGYYSMMVSRHDSTSLLFYVRDDDGILVELKCNIPEGYAVFFHKDVIHAGAEYPKPVPVGRERVFAYVNGWGAGYAVHSIPGITKEEMVAQQRLDPLLHEIVTEEESVIGKKRKK